jgi:threonine/homoserine/homoserine lactone efflux protein
MDIATFILISFVFIAIPGPNVLIVVSTGISHGTMRGLQTIGGISLAMAIQLFIAAIGTTWFVAALSHGFAWLKWGGVFYLLYLGLNHLVSAVSAERPQKQRYFQISARYERFVVSRGRSCFGGVQRWEVSYAQ